MSLLFIDGFDHYATADGPKKWNVFGTGVSISSTAGRRGSGALTFSANNRFIDKTLPGSYTTLIVGMALDPMSGNTADILKFIDGGIVHCGIHLNANNAIVAFRGTNVTVLGTSANSVVAASGYSYIECKVFISDTVGTIDVRVNGASVLSLSGIDTRNAGNASMTGISVRSTGTGALVDDLYICDTSGSSNNDFLGDCRIDTLLPNADGTYSQFTPSTGSSHFALVDEPTPNTADYNESSTVGHRDSYAFGNLSALVANTVYGVQVNATVHKDDAGVRSASTMARSSSTDADGASTALLTSQSIVSQIYETNPNGATAWTESSVNAAEFGVKVTA